MPQRPHGGTQYSPNQMSLETSVTRLSTGISITHTGECNQPRFETISDRCLASVLIDHRVSSRDIIDINEDSRLSTIRRHSGSSVVAILAERHILQDIVTNSF